MCDIIGERDDNFIDSQEFQQSKQSSSCEEHNEDLLGEEEDIDMEDIRGLEELL